MSAKKPNGMAAFDAIAKPKEAKKATTVKIAASVTPAIKTAVDAVINLKAEIKRKESELATQEQTVIEHVQPQQDAKARAGEFSKSFYVEGNDGAVVFNTADAFSTKGLNDKETGAALQETVSNLIGVDKYAEWFRTKRTISLLEAVVNDEVRIGKIVAAVTKAGLEIGEFFKVEDAIVTTDDLDRKQFDLDDQTLTEFRALVPPRKAALKPTAKA
jgi:hypothetical protein